MCLNANILPVFEQLGLFDELMAISLPVHNTELFHGDMSVIADIRMGKDVKQLYVGLRYLCSDCRFVEKESMIAGLF